MGDRIIKLELTKLGKEDLNKKIVRYKEKYDEVLYFQVNTETSRMLSPVGFNDTLNLYTGIASYQTLFKIRSNGMFNKLENWVYSSKEKSFAFIINLSSDIKEDIILSRRQIFIDDIFNFLLGKFKYEDVFIDKKWFSSYGDIAYIPSRKEEF